MAKNNKLVMILERSDIKLNVTNDDKGVVLEGIFAQFGVLNNNDRIYEEVEYLPHLSYLQEKIKSNRLMGELDHPEKFDVSLTKVSHVIESLEYNKEKRQVVGRVRLLNTPPGRVAQELVEAGVPISISSRAAGLVESNKKVKIKRIFTYDLVADPGFNEAVLHKINESVGLSEDSLISIFERKGTDFDVFENIENEEMVPSIQTDKQQKSEMTKNVTADELDAYSHVVKEEIESLHAKINSLGEKADSDLGSHVKQMGDTLSKLQEAVNNITATVDKTVGYTKMVAEKLDNVISYTNYVATTVDEGIRYTEHVADRTDKSILYGEHLKEQILKGIDYANYLKECIETGVNYSEYVGNKADQSILYAEKVAESANQVIEETIALKESLQKTQSFTDYLSEHLNRGIAYTEHISEQSQELADFVDYSINESITSKSKGETVKTEVPVDYTKLTEQVDLLIESTKKTKVDETRNQMQFGFFKAINEAKQTEFLLLDETKKQKVLKAISESGSKTQDDILNVWEASLKVNEDQWLAEAPEQYKKLWESMDERTKGAITAQSRLYKLDTAYRIKNFWETRKVQPVVTPSLNESNEVATVKNSLGYSADYLENVKKALDKSFRPKH